MPQAETLHPPGASQLHQGEWGYEMIHANNRPEIPFLEGQRLEKALPGMGTGFANLCSEGIRPRHILDEGLVEVGVVVISIHFLIWNNTVEASRSSPHSVGRHSPKRNPIVMESEKHSYTNLSLSSEPDIQLDMEVIGQNVTSRAEGRLEEKRLQ